jgi:hypothetical protein
MMGITYGWLIFFLIILSGIIGTTVYLAPGLGEATMMGGGVVGFGLFLWWIAGFFVTFEDGILGCTC